MRASLLDSFKDPDLASKLLVKIHALASELAKQGGQINLMEVCGTHTVAIAKSGLRSVLPPNIRLISGPGCPVCVTANVDIDLIIATTRLPRVTVASFGDMLRVPGSSTSLQERKAEGAAVQVVYSPLDALAMAQQDPENQYVFVGVGFETTAPLVAATIGRAATLGLANFSVLAVHKRVPPALRALANDPEVALDALILPGHVSTILGEEPYGFLASEYNIPAVITGFEPVDILLAIEMLLGQLLGGQASIGNAYGRAVQADGNPAARAAIDAVFTVTDAQWRGLGEIPDSGYAIQEKLAQYDAGQRFDLANLSEPTLEPQGCKCGEVLRGVLAPNRCPLYARTCTPHNPIGPCMVSSEGSCAAYYRYQIET